MLRLFICLLLCYCIVSCNINTSQQGYHEQETYKMLNLKYAKCFQIAYHKNYTLIKIFANQSPQIDTLIYVLVRSNETPPDEYSQAQIIETPINSFLLTSTTQIPAFEMLLSSSKIIAITQAQLVYSPHIRGLVEKGKIQNLGFSAEIDKEKLLTHTQSILLSSDANIEKNPILQFFQRSGGTFIPIQEWLEQHPLGRAEWIKLYGVLLNREKEAEAIFNTIESEYIEAKNLAKKASLRPKMLLGLPYKEIWYMPGGKSYMAQLLRDAAIAYAWENDTNTGSLPLDLEKVYAWALGADYWLNIGTLTQRKNLLSLDTRYKDFRAVKTGNLYHNLKRSTKAGGMDFWESGAMNPHLILKDFIKIAHPDLLPAHSLYYYEKMKE
ncbi:MAG: hypothetical protein EAZ55_09775 [Cytophagales bacterium]|nr:MAG: hypothetical protein EAZ55_09775 [Cytophagales bacterium]